MLRSSETGILRKLYHLTTVSTVNLLSMLSLFRGNIVNIDRLPLRGNQLEDISA